MTHTKWKTPTLSGAMRAPRSGKKPKQLVIYLHGMGGTGHSNIWFAEALQDAMPDAIFYVPDGLEPIHGNEETRQWFEIPHGFKDHWMGLHPTRLKPYNIGLFEKMYHNYLPAKEKVLEFIRERKEFHDISADQTFIIGVSQGAMLAVQMLSEGDPIVDYTPDGEMIPLGGAMIIAGCLFDVRPVEAHPSQSKPEFVLIHGSLDITVPYKGHLLTDKTLYLAGQRTTCKVIWDKDHTFFEHQAMPDILRYATYWGKRIKE